jgi:NADH-quinone oxidoreductase subunit L
LGVLALGAIFSGMLWYGSFFGNHAQVNKFFGMPEQHTQADQSKGLGDDKKAHNEDSAEEEHGADKDNSDGSKDHGTEHYGSPPLGAIFMHPNNHVLDDAHHAPTWVKVSPFVAMLLGFIMALWFYIWDRAAPARVAELNRPLYLFLLNKWYFDEIYDALFVRPASMLGRFLWKRGDEATIDGTINGIAMGIIPFFTRLAGRAQSGYIFTYAFAMVIGIVVFVTWMTFIGGAN